MNAFSPIASTRPFRMESRMFADMIGAGLFDGYPNVELRDGELIEMPPQYNPHGMAKSAFGFAIYDALRALGSDLIAIFEVSVELDSARVPQPDIIIGGRSESLRLYPVGLVRIAVEVSQSTIADDLGWKRMAYAQADIPEYWIVDLPKGEILSFANRGPDGRYTDPVRTLFGKPLAARTIPGLAVDTSELARVPRVQA